MVSVSCVCTLQDDWLLSYLATLFQLQRTWSEQMGMIGECIYVPKQTIIVGHRIFNEKTEEN
jgi:hypothetical protein